MLPHVTIKPIPLTCGLSALLLVAILIYLAAYHREAFLHLAAPFEIIFNLLQGALGVAGAARWVIKGGQA